jgi:hypothetical protein
VSPTAALALNDGDVLAVRAGVELHFQRTSSVVSFMTTVSKRAVVPGSTAKSRKGRKTGCESTGG